MKITLDITELLSQNKISQAEYDKLLILNKDQQKNHYAKILYIFGVVAICIGLVNMAPTFFKELFKALNDTLGVSGLLLILSIGTLAGAAKAKSGFLSSLSCLSIISFFVHLVEKASIKSELDIIIAIVSTALALVSFTLANEWDGKYERVALIYSRTALLCANISFWIISWSSKAIKADSFSIFWALALIALGFWGAKQGRRFVVNICAVFGSIHFFTQYFKIVGYGALSLIIAGVAGLMISSVLLKYNQNVRRT